MTNCFNCSFERTEKNIEVIKKKILDYQDKIILINYIFHKKKQAIIKKDKDKWKQDIR